MGKIAKKSTDSKVSACYDTDLGEALFHDLMFCDEENRDLSCSLLITRKPYVRMLYSYKENKRNYYIERN